MVEPDKAGLLRSIYLSGLWRFFPFLLTYILGIAILFPILPTIVTNGFASEAAGHAMSCEASRPCTRATFRQPMMMSSKQPLNLHWPSQEFTPDNSPKECRDAHSKVWCGQETGQK
jgi:hypothetical protein